MAGVVQGAVPVLQGIGGEVDGRAFPVGETLIVGRAPTCAVQLVDPLVSRRHSSFLAVDGRLLVEDLGSQNGTWVNGERVPRSWLRDGDVVRIGGIRFVVRVPVELDTGPVELLDGQATPTPQRVRPIGRSPAAGPIAGFGVLHEVGRIVQREDEPESVLHAVLHLLLDAMHADRGVFALLDAEGRLSPRAVVDRDGLAEPLSRIRMSRAIARRVLDERVAVVSEDIRTDNRFDGSESLVLAPVRSFVAVPVLLGSAALGLLELSCHRPGESWNESDIELLGIVASMTGSALRTKELARDQNAVIAQLEKVREELIRKQEQLLRAEQMATLGRFAARVAHEAKNHLMPLEVAQLLTERLPDDPEVAEIADLVRESREMLMEMLSEVLGYARGEARPLQKERAPLEPVVRSAARLLRWDEDVSPHTLEVEVLGDCPVDRDLRRLRQVIINLARNGAQAMGRQAGRLRLRVEATPESGIIEVIDDGPGIPPEVARSLFQPLFSTKGEKGVGIGLEISRRIVEEHHGTISFQRGPEGRGTAFRVWLPRAEG